MIISSLGWGKYIQTMLEKYAKSFTLVELLVVVAIIAILASIGLTVYQQYSTRARVAEAIPVLNHVAQSLMIQFSKNGVMPSSFSNISGTAGGNAGTYAIPQISSHLFYDNGSTWTNKGAFIRLVIPAAIGESIPGYIASTDGTDGVSNSIAIGFYEDEADGTYLVYCGRGDSNSTLYIPMEYLPSGCNNDDFFALVSGN